MAQLRPFLPIGRGGKAESRAWGLEQERDCSSVAAPRALSSSVLSAPTPTAVVAAAAMAQ